MKRLSSLLLLLALHQSSLVLPVYTAYPDPNPDGSSVSDSGALTNWKSSKTKIEWGGYFTQVGAVDCRINLNLPQGVSAKYRLQFGNTKRESSLAGNGSDQAIDFGTFKIEKPKWQKISLQGVSSTGKDFGDLKSLEISGEGAAGAKFNLKRRRNAASVHLNWPIEKGEQVDWFYNEVIGQKDPLYTYYEVCGFHRGYFGMQVNDPGVRRIIFSVWDSGNEAVDRSKVDPLNQVTLLAKGNKVVASGFGNEGTGGHSHLQFNWKTGAVEKFLVHAEPSGSSTTYTGYFFDPDQKRWILIASFRAPKDGQYLHGLYSFNEDFVGDNGNLVRRAEFGPPWIHVLGKGWEPITKARFTHDGTGGRDRFDYDFGTEHDRFFLQNGGFEGRSPKLNSTVDLPEKPVNPPKIDFDMLVRLTSTKRE